MTGAPPAENGIVANEFFLRDERRFVALERESAPDVLTVYLPGSDLYAHVAREGPDAARRRYLRRVVDPLVGTLARGLQERGGLEDR